VPLLRRNRDFTLLWSGQALSMLGSKVTTLAYPFLILSLGHSPAAAGAVGFVATLPYLLFQLPAGVWVDRLTRKRLMIGCDVVRGAALAVLALTIAVGRPPLWEIGAIAFVEGTMFVVFNAAEHSAIANVVPPEQLTSAFSLNEARTRAAGLLGAPLGGLLFGLGRVVPFAFDAISYFVSVLTLSLIKAEFQTERKAQERRFRRELVEGFAWLRRHRFLLDSTVSVSLGNLVVRANQLLVIVLATQHGLAPALVGVMLATAGLGGVVGSLIAPRFQRAFSPRDVVIGASLAWAVLFPLFTGTTNPYVFGLAWGGAALVGAIWNVVLGSYQLSVTPDHLRGRVASIGSLFGYGAFAVGSVVSGTLISLAGTEGATWVLRIAIVAVAVATVVDPHIRGHRLEATPVPAA
jgi:MFS family permease